MIKKVFVMCLAAVLAICFAAPGAFAGSEGGVCEDGLFWSLDGGVLTISGSGDMKDYNLKKAPWYDYSENIDEIIIETGLQALAHARFQSLLKRPAEELRKAERLG